MIKKFNTTGNFHFGRKNIFYKLLIFMKKNYEQCSVKSTRCTQSQEIYVVEISYFFFFLIFTTEQSFSCHVSNLKHRSVAIFFSQELRSHRQKIVQEKNSVHRKSLFPKPNNWILAHFLMLTCLLNSLSICCYKLHIVLLFVCKHDICPLKRTPQIFSNQMKQLVPFSSL